MTSQRWRRGHHRPAEIPSALDVEAQLQIEALGFLARVDK